MLPDLLLPRSSAGSQMQKGTRFEFPGMKSMKGLSSSYHRWLPRAARQLRGGIRLQLGARHCLVHDGDLDAEPATTEDADVPRRRAGCRRGEGGVMNSLPPDFSCQQPIHRERTGYSQTYPG